MKHQRIGLGFAFGVALGIAAPALAQQAVQWRVEDGGNGHWYRVKINASGMTWGAARTAAESMGGYLACLESSGESAWILSITELPAAWGTRVGPWLGGYQDPSVPDYSEPAGGWRWVNGAPWNFSDWPPGQPDNAFGAETVMHLITNIACGNSGVGRFINDLRPDFGPMGSCEQLPISFVVEWSADCNGDGIVDYGQILDGTLPDANADGLPDACDCNGDGVVDSQQCRDGTLPDYNTNDIPDCCEEGVPCVVGIYPLKWRVKDGGNGHWYQVVDPAPDCWEDAKAECEQRGGHLATLASGEESDFVRAQLQVGPWYYLGGYQDLSAPDYTEPAGGWRWITGEHWTPLWAWDQPENGGDSQHTLCTYRWGLHDVGSCAGQGGWRHVIEWSADCNGDQIVDYGQILDGTYDDLDSNGIPDCCDQGIECDCPADINQSGTIDAEDLAYVLFAWGMPGGKAGGADINGDATVDANDLSLVLGSWGPCPN